MYASLLPKTETISVHANGKDTTIVLVIGKPQPTTITPIPAVEGVVRSLGINKYTAFPHTAQFSDGEIGMIFKESDNHAAAGALMFGKSNGSLTYNFSQISVSGTPINCANLGIGIFNDRLIVDYQESDAGPIKVIYSDDRGTTWTQATQPFTYPAGYSSAQFGKIIKLGGGRLLLFYYCMPLSTSDPSIAGCLKSDDNGETWAHYTDIAIRDHWDSGTESGNSAITNGHGYTSEIYGVVTDPGTGNSDTKIVVFLRNEELGGASQIHYRSSDGGATWTRVSGTGSIFTVFGDYATAVDKFPVHVIEHQGTFYIFAGARWSGNYRIAYVTVSAADLFNNTGYSAVNVMSYNANADTNAASNDFGYPEPLSRYFLAQSINEILIPFYDSSPTSSGSPRDEMIYQIKITF
jgi:hypothetical protein